MVNSSFGKTCEGKRNRLKIKLTRTEEETLKWTEKLENNSSKIIIEDLVTLCLQQLEILWDKPTIVGACILGLAKKFMFEFHYKIMKKTLIAICFIQTQTLLCMKCARETFLRIYSGKNWSLNSLIFQTSHLSTIVQQEECPCHVKIQAEMGSKTIAEFCGLKSKLYSIKLADGKYKSFSLPLLHHTNQDIHQKQAFSRR